MKFKEIEFKYNAETISLSDFTKSIELLSPSRNLIVSSYDDYFINSTGNFIRYRHNNDHQELTIKRKVKDTDNMERIEVNMRIVPQDFNTIEAFCNLLGYNHDFRIYKVCNIYWVNRVVFSYYLVFDENMKELNRFIEIEADEECEFVNEDEAHNLIQLYEKKLVDLNMDISNEKRLKKSLFEMYTTK